MVKSNTKHKFKYDYSVKAEHDSRATQKRKLHKEILVEVYFCLVLLLALSTVEDLHIKLRRANMKVEGHEEASLDVMVIHKL
jgi:hypothetical protein